MCPRHPNDVQGCFIVSEFSVGFEDHRDPNVLTNQGCQLASILDEEEQAVAQSILNGAQVYIAGEYMTCTSMNVYMPSTLLRPISILTVIPLTTAIKIQDADSEDGTSTGFSWVDGSTW